MVKSQPTLVVYPFRFRSSGVEELSYKQVRRLVKDAAALRLALVRYALAHGVKPAARAYGTSPQTVRAWLRRYREEGITGLEERPHRPKRAHPQTTPPAVESRVVALRERNPRLGQDRIAAELRKTGVTLS